MESSENSDLYKGITGLPVSDLSITGQLFAVQLEMFDGPIDLLLHLVKQNELPIEKLSLAHVAQQYTDSVLAGINELDLDLAGEYLVIASTLLSIKSSILLNKPVEFVEDSDGNLIDPHEELLMRLREAEVFKKSARNFAELTQLGIDVFSSPSDLRKITTPVAKLAQHEPSLLAKAFQRVLKDLKIRGATYTISLDTVSIVDRMLNVVELLKKQGGKLSFLKLIPDATSKGSLVVSFLALLELCKRHMIRVTQEGIDEEIFVTLSQATGVGTSDTGQEQEMSNLTSEFDEQVVNS